MKNLENNLESFDPELYATIKKEKERQENQIELIASENYTSSRVMAAQGSVLTNKYAEGYPNKRYYGGCEFVDQSEILAIERLKKLFKADYANVQPHSGSQANTAVMMALLNPGDTFMGMDLSAGGHLTHGCKVNFSGRLYNAVTYGLDGDTELLDYDSIAKLAQEHKPKLIIAGYSAYSQKIDWQKFRDIADSVNAYLMVDMAHFAGLVAADLYPSPIPYADVVTSTTHKTLRGPRGGVILAKSNPDLEKKFNSYIFPGTQGGPLMHVIAAKAVAFKEALQPEFKEYQKQVIKNAKAMANTLQERGIKIVSNGTENHLLLLNLTDQNISGKDAEHALEKANITTNKNSIPNDTRSPFITSGIRIGTPAVTTRGFKEQEASQIANWIADIIEDANNDEKIQSIKNKVLDLCAKFPVY